VRPFDRFLAWLLAFGARRPGNVLYPTSDDLAWLFAEHEAELRPHFRMLTPTYAAVVRILDKRALYTLCNEVGIGTPRTWFLRDDDDLDAVVRDAPFPLIIKPRTQVLFTTMRKGGIVGSAGELRQAHRAFMRANRYEPRLLARLPEVERPMLQEFCASASGSVYAISGFCDSRHALFVARATRKLVQWPRRAGVGICFEDAPVDEALAQAVRRLCEATGFVGVFEAEFIIGTGSPLLIDFNPRFFGQMGFDVARGLPSPYLVYLAAMNEVDRLRTEVDAALAWKRPAGHMFFVNRTSLAWTRVVERLVGRARSTARHEALESALNSTGPHPLVLDFATDAVDFVPGLLDGVQQIAGVLRHPRAALRAAARGE
jgi:D-aspartate ligase